MPPVYFQVCGQDPLRDHSLIYEDALREPEVKTKLDVYPGLFHSLGHFLPGIPQSSKSVDDNVRGFAFLLGNDEEDLNKSLM